jgi:serine protease
MRTAREWMGRRTAVTVLLALLALIVFTRSGRVAASPQQSTNVAPVQLTAARVAAFLDARDRHLSYVPGEVLVQFKPGVTIAQQQRSLDALRSRPSVDGLHWIATGLALLRDDTQPDATILAQQLSEQPEVQSAQPNYIRRLPVQPKRALASSTAATSHTFGTPNDPLFTNYQWNFIQIDMPDAWNINPGGNPNLIVATLDTGVSTQKVSFTVPLFTGSKIENVTLPFDVSPDLSQSRVVLPRDFVPFVPGAPVLDLDGHGTHVSSTIAEQTNNFIQLAGIAYNVKLMPVKVCFGYWESMIANAQQGIMGFLPPDVGGCPDDAIIGGLHYAADNGAKVINLSLGGTDADDALRQAIVYAVQHGAFVSMAMGNDFQDGNPVEYPASYAPQIDGAMSVAATSKSMHHAYYSSSGSYCEIAAPGGDDSDGGGLDGGFIFQVTLDFDFNDPTLGVTRPRFDRYAGIGFEGTSMATPHVAGLAALLMSQGVTDPAAVEALIKKTAKDLGSPGRDDMFGYGLIQPRAALFGFGIIK